MTAQLDAFLQDWLVATITNITGDINVVSIDPNYRDTAEAPVLSSFAFRDPVTGRYRDAIRPTQTRAHPYFANLLPEGPLRTYLASHARVKPQRDFPLLWLLGVDLPGGLVLRDHDGGKYPPEDGDAHAVAVAAADPSVLRFSLAGVQLKFSVTGSPERGLAIPAHGAGGYWIVKLPDQRFANVPENEFSMMSFAREIGVDVPDSGLVPPSEIGDLPSDIRNVAGQAYYIRRFDRTDDGGRIHTEDFAQLNMIYPDHKYDQFNFDMLTRQVAELLGADAALDVIRRIVFNVGIGNGDMHAKNWSLIYPDGRTPALAPAYDYVSTIVYMPTDNLGMNLAGTKAFTAIDHKLIERFASRARLPRKPVLDAAAETVERMREAWPRLSRDFAMPPEQVAAIEAHMKSIPLFQSQTAITVI